jgi:hypothetical protein
VNIHKIRIGSLLWGMRKCFSHTLRFMPIAGNATADEANQTQISTISINQHTADAVSNAATSSINNHALRTAAPTAVHSRNALGGPARGAAAASHREQDHCRSLRNLACIMGSYLFFITPYTCCGTYMMVTGVQTCFGNGLDTYLFWSPYFICLANPLVVVLAQKDFRAAMKSLFCRKV